MKHEDFLNEFPQAADASTPPNGTYVVWCPRSCVPGVMSQKVVTFYPFEYQLSLVRAYNNGWSATVTESEPTDTLLTAHFHKDRTTYSSVSLLRLESDEDFKALATALAFYWGRPTLGGNTSKDLAYPHDILLCLEEHFRELAFEINFAFKDVTETMQEFANK